mmetsp:Transcript_13485/g.19883  ORF Transcript_13485/g.19883 Transcript_13485/m.19883 type:complete len:391 (+) Transcript_13485:52-1224(+)
MKTICLLSIWQTLLTGSLCRALSLPNDNNIDFTSSSRRTSLQRILLNALAPISIIPPPANAATDEGISAVTDSSIGKSVRKSAIQGARVLDSLDEKWERFSDSLRDENKCDENTGRRLYDNGFRKDGTRVGNPVLGALCNPDPLLPLDVGLGDRILDLALQCAVDSSGNGSKSNDRLQQLVQETENLVRPSFERTARKEGDAESSQDKRNRVLYNLAVYSKLRAISTYLENTNMIRNFQVAWGQKLTSQFAPNNTNRKNYVSPFSEMKDEFEDYDYDKNVLLDALGVLQVTLEKLKSAGIIGHFEISIPYDDYGSVVTIAIDDYVPIGAEILLSEQKYSIGGIAQALVRSILNQYFDYGIDTFYIDPSTTKQSEYNPTQLLLSVNNLRKK